MTGFASRDGADHGWTWTWDMRGVNGRSLDVRLRLPDQPDGLEPRLRSAIQKSINRGNISVSLKLARDHSEASSQLNPAALDDTLTALSAIETAAQAAGVTLGPTRAADILVMKGVLDQNGNPDDCDALRAALIADIDPLIAAFDAMRAQEGQNLHHVLEEQITRVEELTEASVAILTARADYMATQFRANLERVVETAAAVSDDRLAQELAVLAVKADVTEEIDRLKAHSAAARALLAEDAPKGRKLDFLIQEFNREANTLCAKSQFTELTRVGLDLKHTIDQMREQIQNVE